ncbi:histidine phosphatase family protein [Actinopolymorpha pittospori]|uniref:Broad specificity phosphatase PhoE n=1 Tax=Actinopolymorpha pittospori TaxID=648752 RepID=A0A927RCA2_9ACTN|nr:histidine phosphatase family protein [Actinopolymorpha pittospori]MBE1606915.1 broad specificity phosphatase PhoE [Actinopolymorpha pittospori]
MTRLIFVRHGESEANLLHVFSNRGTKHGLTANGRGQALELARRLAGASVARIYTSPLLRAVQTAQILSRRLDVEVGPAEALCEYDVGAYEGSDDPAHWREYEEVLNTWTLAGEWDRRVGGGESYRDIKHRFAPFVEQVTAMSGVTVLVGHGGLYRCMLRVVLTNVTATFALIHPLANTQQVRCVSRF